MNTDLARRHLTTIASLSLLLFGLSAWAQPVLNPANGHYYDLIVDSRGIGWNWQQASENARTLFHNGLQGHLATLRSQEENDFVRDNMLVLKRSWIGGFQPPDMPFSFEPEDGWQWVTGELWTFANWDPGEPNDSGGGPNGQEEDCAHWSRNVGTWNDTPCRAVVKSYVIEFGEADNERFEINAGLNDAWYNAETPGQGFFFTVLADIQRLFLAWFTYDTERPAGDVQANLGEPGHRWLTAFGPYEGDTAVLEVELTRGGVFDRARPAATTQVPEGSITLEFSDCNDALLSYSITSAGVQGQIPLQRIALDNVSLCESLAR